MPDVGTNIAPARIEDHEKRLGELESLMHAFCEGADEAEYELRQSREKLARLEEELRDQVRQSRTDRDLLNRIAMAIIPLPTAVKPEAPSNAQHLEVQPDGTKTPVRHEPAEQLPPGKPRRVHKVQR